MIELVGAINPNGRLAELIAMDKPVVYIRLLPLPEDKTGKGQFEVYLNWLNKAKRDYNEAMLAGQERELDGLMFNILSLQKSLDNFLEKTLKRANFSYEHDQRRR